MAADEHGRIQAESVVLRVCPRPIWAGLDINTKWGNRLEVPTTERTEYWQERAFLALGLSLMLIVSAFLPSYSHTASDPG